MTLVRADAVVTPTGLLRPGWLRIDAGRIVAVGSGRSTASQGEALETYRDATIAPGFVDLHVHGGGGASFGSADPEEIRRAIAFHRGTGTTSTLASLVSAGPAETIEAVARLADLADEGEIAGIHLEGPFLAPARCGAHDPALLLEPDASLLERFLRAGRGHVRMVTLAPELPGAVALIEQLVAAGVVAAIGHSDADHATASAAIDAGATVATHLANAMRPIHQREPGIAVAALERPEVTCELIADGVHLHPALLRLAFQVAPGRCALVTDAIAAAGARDGAYHLGGLEVGVVGGVARLADSGAIAGSTLTAAAALRHAVGVAGIALVDAVAATSEVPARALGLAGVGALATGRRADFVILDRELQVTAVVREGRRVGTAGG